MYLWPSIYNLPTLSKTQFKRDQFIMKLKFWLQEEELLYSNLYILLKYLFKQLKDQSREEFINQSLIRSRSNMKQDSSNIFLLLKMNMLLNNIRNMSNKSWKLRDTLKVKLIHKKNGFIRSIKRRSHSHQKESLSRLKKDKSKIYH
jgi:hypothetical protein